MDSQLLICSCDFSKTARCPCRLRIALPNCLVRLRTAPYLRPACRRIWHRVDGVDRFEHGDLVPVRRCALRHQAEQYALVLAAMGMQSSIVLDGELLVLSVGYRDAARATYELAAYDRENHDTLPRRDRPLPAPPRLEVALSYWAILLFSLPRRATRHFLSTGSEREQPNPD